MGDPVENRCEYKGATPRRPQVDGVRGVLPQASIDQEAQRAADQLERDLTTAQVVLARAIERSAAVKKLVLAREEGSAALHVAEWQEHQARRRYELLHARATWEAGP